MKVVVVVLAVLSAAVGEGLGRHGQQHTNQLKLSRPVDDVWTRKLQGWVHTLVDDWLLLTGVLACQDE